MMKKWLSSGKQTEITSYIRDIADKFKDKKDDFQKIIEMLIWIHDNIVEDRAKDKIEKFFRKRTSEQIIKSGFATGCTDFTLAFIPLARASGIPTKYVEGLHKKYRKGKNIGHVVAECYVDNRWLIVDVEGGAVEINRLHSFFQKQFRTIGVGLDSWDLGIKDMRSLMKYIDKTWKD